MDGGDECDTDEDNEQGRNSDADSGSVEDAKGERTHSDHAPHIRDDENGADDDEATVIVGMRYYRGRLD